MDIVQRDRGLNAFGRYLHRFGDGDEVTNRTAGSLGDQNLRSDCTGFDARREVDVPSYDTVFGPFIRANVAYHNFTRMNANAHFDFRQAIAAIVSIDLRHG